MALKRNYNRRQFMKKGFYGLAAALPVSGLLAINQESKKPRRKFHKKRKVNITLDPKNKFLYNNKPGKDSLIEVYPGDIIDWSCQEAPCEEFSLHDVNLISQHDSNTKPKPPLAFKRYKSGKRDKVSFITVQISTAATIGAVYKYSITMRIKGKDYTDDPKFKIVRPG